MDYDTYDQQPRTSAWGILAWLLLSLVCFTVSALFVLFAGSVLVAYSGSRSLLFLLGVGTVAALLPGWMANASLTWLRSYWNRRARFFETWLHVTLVVNTAWLLVGILLLPDYTSKALSQYGKWPFGRQAAQLFQIQENHPILETGRKLVDKLAFFLEEERKGRRATSIAYRPTASRSTRQPPQTRPQAATPRETLPEPVPAKTRAPALPSTPPALAPQQRTAAAPTPSKGPIVRLRFQRFGTSLVVPITLQDQTMKILLDTGASFLTLSRKVARRLNVEPPDDAPTLTLQTANGKIQAHLGLLPRVRLGQHTLRNVSFVLCDACADRKHNVIGLLGLNILRRYLMTLDQANGQVLLTPQPSTRDRSADIRPFLQYQSLQGSTRQSFLSRRFVLKGIARNRATLGMSRLKIQVSYLRGKKIIGKRTFRLPAIRSGQQRRFTFKDSRAPRFERYRLDIAYGEWLPRNNDFDLP